MVMRAIAIQEFGGRDQLQLMDLPVPAIGSLTKSLSDSVRHDRDFCDKSRTAKVSRRSVFTAYPEQDFGK